jgi:hypothetical protein
MKLRPLHDRILAGRTVEQDQTSGGLLIPDRAREKPREAHVIAVGSGAAGEPLPHDVERVLGGVEQHAAGARRREAAQARDQPRTGSGGPGPAI